MAHKPIKLVQKSKQQVLIAYCSSKYTVIVDMLLLVRTKSTTKKLLIYSDLEIIIVE